MSVRGHHYNKLVGSGVHSPDGPGMHYIKALKASIAEELIEVKPGDLIVGSFGIITDDGRQLMYSWKVDGWRKESYKEEDPTPMSSYSKSLLESMFTRWQ